MMKHTLRMTGLALATVIAAAAPARAEDVNSIRYPAESWGQVFIDILEKGPVYLDRAFDVAIAPPPANDSPETRAELDALEYLAAHERDSDTLRRIGLEHNDDLWDVFAAEGLSPVPKSEKADAFLYDAVIEVGYFLLREKQQYQRARPSQLRPDLALAVDNPPHSAYPSGHGGQAMMIALIFGAMDPARAAQYEQFARDIGHRREIAGIHYPSDTAAGQQIARAVFPALMENPQFKEKFDAVKSGMTQTH